VNFLICHPQDRQFNAPNQRYWPEHHEVQGRFVKPDTFHLVRPSPNNSDFIKQKNIVPFSQWITLSPTSLIHGPFDFAVINGRKTRDRIPQSTWDAFRSAPQVYQNPIPRFDLSSYAFSYHINTQHHTIHRDESITKRLNAVAIYNHFNSDE
jgi:hypothetical protein